MGKREAPSPRRQRRRRRRSWPRTLLLVGVVAAISAGGAGAVFWMWISALLGSSTAFVEATLAQLYK